MSSPRSLSRAHDDRASNEGTESLLRQLAAAHERIRSLEEQLQYSRAPESPAHPADEQLRTLLGNLHELIFLLTPDRRITDVAGNSMGLVGYAASELRSPGVASDVLQLFDASDAELVEAQFAQARLRPQGSSIDVRIVDRAGESRWVECTLVPLYSDLEQGMLGLQMILRDISERVRSEQMVRALNDAAAAVQQVAFSPEGVIDSVTEQLRQLGLNSGVGLYTPDATHLEWVRVCGEPRFLQAVDILRAQPTQVALEGFPSAWRMLQSGVPAVLQLDQAILERKDLDPAMARQIAQLLGKTTVVVVPLRAEGQDLGYLVVGASWLNDDSVPAIVAYANQTAIAIRNSRLIGLLADSETQYRAIFESARDGILVLDPDGRVAAASQTTCRLFGMAHATLIGQSAEQLFSLTLDEIAAACQEGGCADDSAIMLAQALPQSAEAFPVELRGSRLQAGERTRLMLLITDISERIRAQEALIQSERLGALGQMAGGIAHDFNNILVSILGYTQLAGEDLARSPDRLREDLAQIESGARDAAEAVSRLQALYRDSDDVSDLVPVQLDDVLSEALALHRPRWKDIPQVRGVTYRLEWQLTKPPAVFGNPSELRRVLSNLLINALDAMPTGGNLTFASWHSDGESCISISDTGTGIAPEILPRVFEPFFTTKRSSGLGLTICANIVRRHGATMNVETQPGLGTKVTLRFPACGPEPTPGRQVAEEAPKAGFRALEILVIDDEPRVRDVLVRVLEREGHRARAAASGPEGLDILRRQRFDLLICDLGMPDLPGSAVMRQAHSLAPEMPILLTTGWGDTVTPEQLADMCASGLLAKPFGQNDVRLAIDGIVSRTTAY